MISEAMFRKVTKLQAALDHSRKREIEAALDITLAHLPVASFQPMKSTLRFVGCAETNTDSGKTRTNSSLPTGGWIMNANPKLLTGIEALTKPNFHELNEYDGRNDRLLHAVLCAYAKHHLGNVDIGWDKLGEILHDVICNEIGDENYCAWAEKIKDESP